MGKEDKPHSPTRRGFLRRSLQGIAAGGVGMATASGARANGDPAILEVQPWGRDLGVGVDARGYGMPSKYEMDVHRTPVDWLTADPFASINFTPIHRLEGVITPNGLCFERHHSGAAQIDPAKHRLMINGLVERPLVFTMEDIRRLPCENHVYFLECTANGGMEWRGPQMNGVQFTHGMIHNVMYTGVPLRHLLAEAGVKPSGRWVLFEGADAAGLSRSVPLEKVMDDCLVAFAMNGEALRAEQGYPLRLVIPGWEGNMWIKWLRRIEVAEAPWHTKEETSKYTDLMADGRARRFSWIMDVKSVITNPSPQMPIRHDGGRMILSGLAWSGHGTIPRVDVSIDGGKNWVAARIDGPVLEKSLQRFYYEFEWDGREMLLQSRAHDSAGNMQPTKAQLRALRGVNSTYHNNGIQTWFVDRSGEVENVEVS